MASRRIWIALLLAGAVAAPLANATAADFVPVRRVVEEVIVTEPPPPPREEVIIERPSPRHVWVQGHWQRNGNEWLWVAGHWQQPPRHGAGWVPGHWDQRPRGWVWVPGHWA